MLSVSSWGRLLDVALEEETLSWVLDVDVDVALDVGFAVLSLDLPLSLAAGGIADGPALEVRLGGLKGSLRRFCWGSPAMMVYGLVGVDVLVDKEAEVLTRVAIWKRGVR